jgi:putative hydrolase of the HAD superfamily
MPNMVETLQSIHKKGLPLGIVSNAQYFTPMILKHFFEVDTFSDPLPLFHERLQVYSFETGRAKPDVFLYELMAKNLIELGLKPDQCLYVGNDMLNDISPASEVGFKTVLYAGDERSLRLRENHPRCIDCKPDRSVTSLSQILNIIG